MLSVLHACPSPSSASFPLFFTSFIHHNAIIGLSKETSDTQLQGHFAIARLRSDIAYQCENTWTGGFTDSVACELLKFTVDLP